MSEKQTPQVDEKVEKAKQQMEGLESSAVLRRQTLSREVDALAQTVQPRSLPGRASIRTNTSGKEPRSVSCVRTVSKPYLF